jgi:predicted DNA-binding transcriptional regulator AlpA
VDSHGTDRPDGSRGGVSSGTLTLPETARRLGIAKTTLYDLIRRGDPPFGTPERPGPIPVHWIGNQRRTLVAEVERYLAGNTAAAG